MLEYINKVYKELTKFLEDNNDNIVIINNKIFLLNEVMRLSLDDLYKLLSVKPGMKLYKYCPFNKYTKANIINGNIYLNDPLKFDDAFDSLSDVEQYSYVNIRLQFYLQLLEAKYDYKASNDELEKLLFIKMGEIADTFDAFAEYLDKINIDIISKLKLKILYQNAMLTKFTKKGTIKKSSKYSIRKALVAEYDEYSKSASKFRISCFTTNPLNLKMWSLYANNNKGVCIEYTVGNEQDKLILSVLYSHIRGDFNTCIAYENINNEDAFMKTLINSVLRKDISWVEQNEYRYIVADGMYKDNLVKFYPITGIYMGNKISKRNYKFIYEICKELNINCYYMQRNLINYELFPKKLEK